MLAEKWNLSKVSYTSYLLLLKFISALSNYPRLLLAGVKIGKHVKFYGLTRFLRKPSSVISIGNNCEFRSTSDSNLIGINHKCIIATHMPHAEILIGNNCGFSGVTIGAFEKIVISDDVKCGANVVITDSDWHLDDVRIKRSKPVLINKNVWIGLNTIILKGVSIGENSVIGAGSVVTKDIPANCIAAGNPCKIIKTINGRSI